MEEALIGRMRESAPDLSPGEAAPLNLRVAAQELHDAGFSEVRQEHVVRTLSGIAQDGRGDHN